MTEKNRCAILVLQAAEIIFKEEKAMRFFVDTADVEEIRKANDMGVICGVTTNPSLIAKSGRKFEDVIKEITSIVDGPISGEVKATTTDAEGMIKEGREIAAIHPNMVVKIPMTVEGLKAVKVLSSEGIKTNVTLIFSAEPGASGSPGRCNLTYLRSLEELMIFPDTVLIWYVRSQIFLMWQRISIQRSLLPASVILSM